MQSAPVCITKEERVTVQEQCGADFHSECKRLQPLDTVSAESSPGGLERLALPWVSSGGAKIEDDVLVGRLEAEVSSS